MFGDSHYKTSAKNTFFHTVVDLPLARAAASSGSEQPPFGPITAIFLVMAESCERKTATFFVGCSRVCPEPVVANGSFRNSEKAFRKKRKPETVLKRRFQRQRLSFCTYREQWFLCLRARRLVDQENDAFLGRLQSKRLSRYRNETKPPLQVSFNATPPGFDPNLSTMRLPLIGQNRPIFMGNLRLFWRCETGLVVASNVDQAFIDLH